MIIRYTPCPVRSAVPSLARAVVVPRPILAVKIAGPSGYRLRDGLLDTDSDETILDPSLAPQIGVDLSHATERELHLVGRGQIRCKYAPVTLRITDSTSETYEWDALVGFAPFPLLRSLLGFGGFLQFFDANFRGAAEGSFFFQTQRFRVSLFDAGPFFPFRARHNYPGRPGYLQIPDISRYLGYLSSIAKSDSTPFLNWIENSDVFIHGLGYNKS